MTSEQTISLAADRLYQATIRRAPVAPVRDLLTGIDVAYRVQQELVRRRTAKGAQVVGRKIGLTSEAVQRQLGVDQPDYGVLFDDMAYADGATVPVDRLLQPKIEAEVAFVLAADLSGEIGPADVRAAVGGVLPALEIVDSRVADWDITIVDTVADNGSSGLYVLGSVPRSLDEVEPRDVTMTMTVDGAVVSTGDGAACLGDPLAALLWLARLADRSGDPLRAGQVVLSGALGPMAPVAAGNEIRAEIDPLGSVAVRIGVPTTAQFKRPGSSFGPLLEGFVLMELARQQSWNDTRVDLYHYRTRDQVEVDAVLENRRGEVVGIEVKVSSTPRSDDFRGLRHLQDRLGDDFLAGVVLHTGQHTLPFGPKLRAMPISALWELEP